MCQKLIAVLKQAPKIIAQMNKTIIHEYPELQEKSIVPNEQVQEVVADDGVYGLSKVTVDAVNLQEKSVTPSAQLQEVVPDEGYTGISKVNVVGDENLIAENIKKDVEVFGVQGVYEGQANEYNALIKNPTSARFELSKLIQKFKSIDTSSITSMESAFIDLKSLEEVPMLDTSNVTNMYNMFYNCNSLVTIPQFDTSKVNIMKSMFYDCEKLTGIPKLNTSNVTNMSQMFYDCKALTGIPELNTSNVTNMSKMFYNCYNLLSVPSLNTSKVTDISYMFYYCQILTEILGIDTSNSTNMSYMFYHCDKIVTIPELNAAKVVNLSSCFNNCPLLENFGGLKDLGKAYTQKAAGYSYYTVNLTSPLLTHESLMNVINGLYDLNLTYDVENGGTLYRQKLNIGSTNKAKLTEEEIAIATAKGWDVT